MATMAEQLPDTWRTALAAELREPYVHDLHAFVEQERAEHEVFPPAECTFAALAATPYEQVRVLLLGQDPYHDVGQAHGLCFSVQQHTPLPPSLKNMFRELRDDLGHPLPITGDLTAWAKQGVLLLNAVLTVRAHQPASHQRRGWEQFTDAIIRVVNERPQRVVFLLWGSHARKKAPLIDTSRHVILAAAHPSPLSARRGFFGSKPFSQANAALREAGLPEIDWRLR